MNDRMGNVEEDRVKSMLVGTLHVNTERLFSVHTGIAAMRTIPGLSALKYQAMWQLTPLYLKSIVKEVPEFTAYELKLLLIA